MILLKLCQVTLSSPIVEQYQNSNHVIDGDVGGVVQVVGQVCRVTAFHSDSRSVALHRVELSAADGTCVRLTSAYVLCSTNLLCSDCDACVLF